MCGIVGTLNLTTDRPIEGATLRQMLAMIRHRGPDQFGVYLDERIGMGSARLSIVDLSAGQQPIANEDGSVWIVFNGEIFNHVELRRALEARGHRFVTRTDTEVILHLYEDLGPACLAHLNGQFAIAIWDVREQELFLARDRLGVRPLFYTQTNGALIFGSEIKALLAHPGVSATIDPIALDQIFSYWSTLAPRTIFENIVEVPPGHYLLACRDKVTVERYWRLSFGAEDQSRRDRRDYLDELRSLLVDATRIRLRADVPVVAYLSGGLDSSTIAAIVRNYTSTPLETFSVTFDDPEFDEGDYQRRMADHLGTTHHVAHATHADIGTAFPEVVWHIETPVLRTSPVPLFLLSKLVRDHHFKVALTGEGADEFLGGYDIFKEAKVRRFWARQPASSWRPLLLQRLYPDITSLSGVSGAYRAAFFRDGLTDVTAPGYSHTIRWRNTSRAKRFFSEDIRRTIRTLATPLDQGLSYPPEFQRWDSLQQAQYLEITTFLSQYLLSSQGDRVGMAHSVEGRFPFLDYRVVEFCNRLPARLKLRGLNEKYLLKKLAREWLPEEIWRRPKRPFRAPIHRSFFGETPLDYVRELLSPAQVRATGLFSPEAVTHLTEKVARGVRLGETDDMALVGILSSQLVSRQFVTNFTLPPPLPLKDVKMCGDARVAEGAL